MARVDKTDSTIGVNRALLAADIEAADYGVPLGVSINSSGLAVIGAEDQSGYVGIVIASRYNSAAGMPIDIFKFAEIVDCEGLVAGTKYFADVTDGTLTATATSNVFVGYTIEADRLVLAGF